MSLDIDTAEFLAHPREVLAKLGVPFRTDGSANPFGIRGPSRVAGTYDDILGVWWVEPDGLVSMTTISGTVDPGSHYLRNPTNPNRGTLVLASGHYNLVFKVGVFRNEPALLQQGFTPFTFHLDTNRDDKIDLTDKMISGWHGVHWHRPFGSGDQIGLSSAGCQVSADLEEHRAIMQQISNRAIVRNGEKFVDYTLLQQKI